MRRKQEKTALMWLMMLIAVALGFYSGFHVLPQSGILRSPVFSHSMLHSSLPYTQALAEEAPLADVDTGLLLQASLPAGSVLLNQTHYAGEPAYMPPEEPAEILAQEKTALPDKAEPRLIMIGADSVAAFAALNMAEQAATAQPATGEPRIAVYCTHSSEEYKNQARVPGARGGVHTVAQRLSDSLNAAGLSTIYCDTVHDYPDWDLSYATSLASAQALQKQYPSLEVFIDVHRDSLANSVLSTGSGQVARIMLVVGSNERLEHPNWQKNKAFAEQIKQRLEAATPGLMRSVSIHPGRYNQHISTKAILVEMGSTANTVEEACKSAELLAAALAEIL